MGEFLSNPVVLLGLAVFIIFGLIVIFIRWLLRIDVAIEHLKKINATLTNLDNNINQVDVKLRDVRTLLGSIEQKGYSNPKDEQSQ